ncbi:SDR family NAD(P)-dependent oxidoreductase [Roseibium sp. Sym1]|uniref:SDR family NAD(P)-dependent oxidoreductase n=1 Tax=Roseibium sp. Sym1 TaxID=3016006 RepID=UPI0022B5C739|nr:glucose 1-dehydrogenase [Roseibium sp. Sym1]
MADTLFDVSGKTVLVSGGSRGIGLAVALAFAERGARVIITGRDETSLREACGSAEGSPERMTHACCDVADPATIQTCVDDVVAEFGRIDTLINCAGVNIRKPAVDYSPEEFDAIMDINLRGAFFMAQAVGRHMIGRGEGCIVNVDSLTSSKPLTQIAPYSMSKAGLSSMTRALALEWGAQGVRVNGLAPGFILTELTRKLWADPNLQSWNRTVTPLGRMGSVEDLVGAAIFLASPASAFLTGQTIRVDGGITCGLNWPIGGDYQVTCDA